jgi:hypothetical protein
VPEFVMEHKDLLALVFNRWEFFVRLCEVYQVLALALLAFVMTSPTVHGNIVLCGLVAVAFVGSAVGNLTGLLVVCKQWSVLAEAAKARLATDPVLAPVGQVLEPPSRKVVIWFHLVGDATFITALGVIWWLFSQTPTR